MKTILTSIFKNHFKITGMVMLLTVSFFSFEVQAQGDRRQGNRPEQVQGGGDRQATRREPSMHQQSPVTNHFPSPGRNPGNAGVNADRGTPRINNNNNFNRPRNNTNNYNRPENNDRPGNVAYNRPGNNNRSGFDNNRPGNNNRPGFNGYNRPGNNFNNGYRRGRDYNGYNNYRRPNYTPGNPNWRYAYAPRRNSVFYTLPSSYFSLNFGGFGYRYYDGIFYRPYNNIFRVVAPPIGIYINTLPYGYSRIYVHDYPYYYYNGTYYDYRDNNYTVVSPPVGAVVESIPDGYETVTIDGETYYTVDGAQYKPVTQNNGEIWYEVIKAN